MEKRVEITALREGVLEQLLKEELHLTQKQIRQAKYREEGICINHKRARVTEYVKEGDIISVLLETDQRASDHLVGDATELYVLYEDEDLIIIDKPAGTVVHPSHGHYGDSIANRLVYYFQQKDQTVCVRSIGRLDKDTSGVLVFAKNQVAAGRLARQREHGIFQKEYLAVVLGKLKEKHGVIRKPIGKMPGELMKMTVQVDGSPAVTRYQVIEEGEQHSVVSLQLETGRTHQIRVHMAWSGCPLVGDPIYGEPSLSMKRTALHAWKVTCKQPFTNEMIEVESPIPEDMKPYISMT